MVSPTLLQDHFFPRFRQVIAPLKEAGIKAIWHSDGDTDEIHSDGGTFFAKDSHVSAWTDNDCWFDGVRAWVG